ncbi:hypothetical protein MNBD_PLANCTO02-811 [hydrothermal vent metagenome]|uniref:DUF3311 domain-containing protein n=1 Tax=hydrothermal vent metagenome TaxID=652676 RepID=A0A3B1DN24_9ZZZZ
MKYGIWVLIAMLIILHQDNWFWEDKTLVFGFMPITLLYHAGISVAAGVTWLLAVLFIWPTELEEETSQERKGAEG